MTATEIIDMKIRLLEVILKNYQGDIAELYTKLWPLIQQP